MLRRALLLGVMVLGSCRAASVSGPPAPAPTVAAKLPDAGGVAAASGSNGSDPSPPDLASEAVHEPVAPRPAEAKPSQAAIAASFGQALEPGLYVFPDGLRLQVEQIANCDFDTSVPCFDGTYRARATLGKREQTLEWSTRSTQVLGHRVELVRSRIFIVRK